MTIYFWNAHNPPQYEDRFDPDYGDMYTVQTDGGMEIGLSNDNALEILRLLGVPKIDYFGNISAKDLEILCRRAIIRLTNISSMDQEIPDHIEGNFIEVGRPKGYLRSRIDKLLELCSERITDNDEICWA